MSRRHCTDRGGAADLAGARLARQATASLAALLAERELSRRELADRMGVSPGRISQILSGDENLTLRSIAAVATALDVHVEITVSEPSTARPPEAREAAKPYAATPR
ncbi:helix-turn-helix transcriptional regulator [Streptomyces sp. NPDC020096]